MLKTYFSLEQDFVYYDISIYNNSEQDTETEFPLSFIETRPDNILERCTDYYLSVVRFNLGLIGLPCFIPKILKNQENINLTAYKFILDNNGTLSEIPIIWEPQNLIAKAPPSPVTLPQFTDYYYCYDYRHFLNILNKALANAGLTGICYFQLNTATNNIELITSNLFTGSNPTIKLSCNENLKNLLSTFEFKKTPTNPSLINYQSPYYWTFQFAVNPVAYSGALYITSTYTTPLAMWNPISSIVFTSATIPVCPNAIGPTKFYSSDIPIQQNSNNIIQMITDFELAISPGNFYTPVLSYLPTAEYRLVSMFGNGNFNQVQISIQWKDYYGGLHIINLGNNANANIKLLFKKKSAKF